MIVDKGFQVCKGVCLTDAADVRRIPRALICTERCPPPPAAALGLRPSPSSGAGRAAVRPARPRCSDGDPLHQASGTGSCPLMPGRRPRGSSPVCKLLSLSRGLLGNLNPDRLFRRTCLKKGIACDRAGRRRPGVCGPAMPSRDHRASMTPPQAALSGLRVSPGSGPILLFF